MGGNGGEKRLSEKALFVNNEGEPEPFEIIGEEPRELIVKGAHKELGWRRVSRTINTVADLMYLETEVMLGRFKPTPGLLTQFCIHVCGRMGLLRWE